MAHIYNIPPTPSNHPNMNNYGKHQDFVENFHPYSPAKNFDLSASLIRDPPMQSPPRRLTYATQLHPLDDSVYQVRPKKLLKIKKQCKIVTG